MKNLDVTNAADRKTAAKAFDHYITEHVESSPALKLLVEGIEADFGAGQMFGIAEVRPTPETAVALRLIADGLDYAWGTTAAADAPVARG